MLLNSLIFVLGLIIGSFLNVCIYRIPRKEDIVYTPSHCMNCGTRVKWYDLVPVVSWIALGGKCRQCKTKISIQYPIIELSNGAAYLGIYYLYGIDPYGFMLMGLFSVLLVISLIDLKSMIIPNSINFFILICGITYRVIFAFNVVDMVIGFFSVSLFLLIVSLVSKGGMGLGDVKLMAVCGLLLGWQKILLAMMIGSIVGSMIGLVLIALKIVSRKQRIPFGPFLALGVICAGIFGEQIITMYINMIIQ